MKVLHAQAAASSVPGANDQIVIRGDGRRKLFYDEARYTGAAQRNP